MSGLRLLAVFAGGVTVVPRGVSVTGRSLPVLGAAHAVLLGAETVQRCFLPVLGRCRPALSSAVAGGQQVGSVARGPVTVEAAVHPVGRTGGPVTAGCPARGAVCCLALIGGDVAVLGLAVSPFSAELGSLSPAEQQVDIDILLSRQGVAGVGQQVASVSDAVSTVGPDVSLCGLVVTGVGDSVALGGRGVAPLGLAVPLGDGPLPLVLRAAGSWLTPSGTGGLPDAERT